MTIDELNNALADMREKMLAKGYPDPSAAVHFNSGNTGKMNISLFKRENGSFQHLGAVYGENGPYEAVTTAYQIIDRLPDMAANEAIKRDLAAAVERARAAGVDVAAVIGGE